MRKCHRKTLIKKEKWPLIDGWYWCPKQLIEQRIANEHDRLSFVSSDTPIWIAVRRWEKLQYNLTRRLAHACDDGKIRAPIEVEYYKKKRGGVTIHGRCKKCDTKLTDGIKCIIIMEFEMND